MPHHLVCPHCAKPLGVEERFLRSELACPHCQQTFLAPEPWVPELRSFACPACGHGFQVAWPSTTLQIECPTCQQAVRLSTGQDENWGREPPPRIVTKSLPEIEPAELAGEAIDIPTEDGGTVTIREPVKTVRRGAQRVVLRRLSPEEKRRRRAIKNVVFCIVGALLLVVAMMVLQRFAV